MPPDEPAVTGAPLRFGERARGADDDLGDAVLPAGPPPLREAAHDPVVARRDVVDDEPIEARNGRDEPVVEAAPKAREPRPSKREADTATVPKVAPADLASMKRRERKQVAKRRARKVKRIVRRVDAWSVLKVAFIFNLCVYIVSMVAGVVLWRVADGAGVIENVESFIEDLGAFETYRFEPDLIFQAYALGGAVLAVLGTGLIALGAVLFNLISDLVGGIRMTVIEEPGSLPARRRKSGGKRSEAPATVTEP